MRSHNFNPSQQLSQNTVLSQQQIHSLQMLALTTQELDDFMQQAFLENPALEWLPERRNHYPKSHAEDAPPPHEPSQNLYADHELWKKQLIDQLRAQSFTAQEQRVIAALLEWADDDGLFRTPLAEFCEGTGYDPRLAARCLETLRTLDPPGIFAESISHCLIRQAEKRGVLDETLRTILLQHLEAVATGCGAHLASQLGISRTAADRYIALIKTLYPHPLNGEVGDTPHYVVPDVTLYQTDGQWEAVLNESAIDSYQLNPDYATLYRQADNPEVRAYLKQSLSQARMLLSALHQRHETMMRLTEALIRFQRPWLEHRGPLLPLTMTQLAEQLQVHPSTVSRTVKGKYMETPTRGVIAMKDLFSRDVSAGGISANAQLVQERIRELLAHEPRTNPYSDQKIVSLLALQDIYLSRRTVAKYRQQMLVPSAFARKYG